MVLATQPNDAQVNYSDFNDDAETTGTDVEGDVNYSDFDDENAPPSKEPEADGDQEAEAESEADEENDAFDDDLDGGETDAAKSIDEIDLGDGVKITKAEAKELVAAKETYSRYQDELQIVRKDRETLNSIAQDYIKAGEMLKGQYDIALRMIHEAIPPMPGMDLLNEDPRRYMIEREQHEQGRRRYEAMRDHALQEIRKAEEAGSQAMAREESQHKEAEIGKLLRAVPALNDAKKAEIYLQSAYDAAKQYGYSVDEVKDTILRDHRAALILRKAALYDAMKAKKQTPIPTAGAPRATPAPTRSHASPQKQVDRRSLTAALDRAVKPNSSRPQTLRDVGRFFNDD